MVLFLLVICILGCSDDDEPQTHAVQDIDGNVYAAKAIGSQVWMIDNLRVTKLNDGTAIPYVTDDDDASILTTGAFTYYGDNPANQNVYGALYNWHAVNSGKLCPTGWHIPSDSEWTTLINSLGGEGVAGGDMKAIGTSHWSAPNTGATNNSGFTALPAGYLYDDSEYHSLGNVAHWWTSTQSDADAAFDRYVTFQSASATKGTYNKEVFYSCRCLKD